MKGKFVCSVLLLLLATAFCEAKGKKSFFVADRKVECAGNFACIQIKEKSSAQWRVYSDTIEGFNYEEGYEYKISVMPVETKNTMVGLYEEKYKLVKVISKKKTGYDPAQKLGEKKWILVSMNDTHRTLTTGDTSIFIQFNLKDGTIKGKNTCNTFTGKYTAQGAKISLTNIGSTKMMCPKSQTMETIMLEFYNKMTTYKITGDKLTLYQPDGSDMIFEGR